MIRRLSPFRPSAGYTSNNLRPLTKTLLVSMTSWSFVSTSKCRLLVLGELAANSRPRRERHLASMVLKPLRRKAGSTLAFSRACPLCGFVKAACRWGSAPAPGVKTHREASAARAELHRSCGVCRARGIFGKACEAARQRPASFRAGARRLFGGFCRASAAAGLAICFAPSGRKMRKMDFSKPFLKDQAFTTPRLSKPGLA